MKPLEGKKILVTRAADQASHAKELLESHGAEAVLVATIDVRSLQNTQEWPRVVEAAMDLAAKRYTWVALTSDNGVRYFMDALHDASLDARAFDGIRVCAIGAATARACKSREITVDFVSPVSTGEGLTEALLAKIDAGEKARVLLPRAKIARDVFPDAMRAAGHAVDVVPVYETLAAGEDAAKDLVKQIESGALYGILFTSSSTVKNFVGLVGKEGAEAITRGNVVLASIGPVTTATAIELGLNPLVTASDHTLEGLVRALESHAAQAPLREPKTPTV